MPRIRRGTPGQSAGSQRAVSGQSAGGHRAGERRGPGYDEAMGPSVYVALGDSISIDEYAGGPGRGGASLLARNRDDDFPEWAGRDLATAAPGTRFELLATDGATSATLMQAQLPEVVRLAAAGAVPTLVTLTVGGNDVLREYGDTAAARAAGRRAVDRVVEALGTLRSLADEATLVVGTVYDPSDGTGDATAVGLPPWPEVPAVIEELNAGLVRAARENGARVADVHARFLGHGLRAGNPAQWEARPAARELWYCRVIEPNAWGAGGVRAAFWAALHPEEAA